MKLHRKQFTTLALAALATGFLGSATAQSAYPSKTVTMVVPTAAGGTTDLSARMLAQALGPVLGQTVVVDNKGGGNGNIAASIVKRAEADGYTLLMQYSGYHVISPHITKQKQWDQGDFQPVANVISAPQIIVVRADLPVKTLPELIAYAKANPGKLNYASPGNGSPHHLAMEMFKLRTGTFITHIPYRGAAPAMTDVMGGQVPCMFLDLAAGLPVIQSGKVRALAIGSAQRATQLPHVPTLAEGGVKNSEVFAFQGLLAPAGLPPAITARLNGDLNKALDSTAVKKRMADFSMEAMPGTPEQFKAFARAESKRWGEIIRTANIRLD